MSLKRLQEAARYMFTSWFLGMANVRTKRLTSLASLFAYLKGSTELDAVTIAKMNAVMALSSDESAIKLPVHLSRIIWCDRNGTPLVSKDVMTDAIQNHDQEAIEQVVASVVKVMPDWLRYSGEADIKADLWKLFGATPSLIETANAA